MSESGADLQSEPSVSGFYGPGTYLGWLFIMASVPLSLMNRRHQPTPPPRFPPADVIAAVLYPIVAAGDAAVRLADTSVDWDHVRDRCPLFEVALGSVEGVAINPYAPKLEADSHAFLSQCVGLQLALEVTNFFQGLSYFFIPMVVIWILRRRHEMSRREQVSFMAILALPPLWCTSVGISAMIRIKASSGAFIFFLLNPISLYKLLHILLLICLLAFTSSLLALSCVFLTWAALESREIWRRGTFTVNDVVFPLCLVFFGLCPIIMFIWMVSMWLPWPFPAIVFLDDVVGISLSELDQVTAALGGLVTFIYAAYTTGVLHLPFRTFYRFVRNAAVKYEAGLWNQR